MWGIIFYFLDFIYVVETFCVVSVVETWPSVLMDFFNLPFSPNILFFTLSSYSIFSYFIILFYFILEAWPNVHFLFFFFFFTYFIKL